MGNYVLAYDVGTTGIKTCLIEIDKSIKILSAASQGYELYVLPAEVRSKIRTNGGTQ